MKKLIVIFLLLALPLLAADKPVVTKPTPPADLTAPPENAERLPSGLVTRIVNAGTGTEKPAADDLARIRVTVWKSDGSLVQSVPAPQSLVLPIEKMLPGWAE